MKDDILFHEIQRFRQPVLIAIIIVSALPTVGLFGYAMVSQLVFNADSFSPLLVEPAETGNQHPAIENVAVTESLGDHRGEIVDT